jgi:hypothetical protein
MLVRERCKYVRDGLLYTYICMCIALSVGFVHCFSITYRDFLCMRTNKTVNFQVSEKLSFIEQITLFTISLLISRCYFGQFLCSDDLQVVNF